LQWNCRGFYANISNIVELVDRYNPVCMALQELILGRNNVFAYQGYHSMHSPGRGGAGLLIRKDTHFTKINLRTTLQAVAATLYMGKQYTVCSIYIPPNYPLTKEEMEELLQQLTQPFMLLGDFNGRDPLWGDTVTTPHAQIIKRILHDYDVAILNKNEPTHYQEQTQTYSCIDLSLISSRNLAELQWKVITPTEEPYDSDHFPIMIEQMKYNIHFPGPARWNIKKADWKAYTRRTEFSQDTFGMTVEQLNEKITLHMIEAANNSVPRTSTKHTKPPVPWWTTECAKAKQAKKRAYRKYERTRLLIDRIEYKRMIAILRKTIKQAKRKTWEEYISSINEQTTTKEVWRKVKKISKSYKSPELPAIKDENGYIQTEPRRVADLIANTLAKYSSGHIWTDSFKRKREREDQTRINFGECLSEYNDIFTMTEFKAALKQCKNTSPGPDEIHYEMIRHAHETTIAAILQLFNKIWIEAVIPQPWKAAIVIPIKKEGKDGQNPENYRPISLTSCLCKLMERMASKRLTWYLEKEECINPKQFGFRKYQSTADPLLMVEHDIAQAFNRKRNILAVSFDLEKAYDTTWRKGIAIEMHKIGLRGRLPTFVSQLIMNRTFRVRIGTALSEEKEQTEGIPQGSVLSCLCFTIATNGLKNSIPNDITHTLYVDDLLIYYEGKYLHTMERRMQTAVNQISQWAENHGYRFSNKKTKCIMFKQRGRVEAPNLTLYNEGITVSEEVNYLGITFDRRLNWKSQIRNLKAKCQSPIMLLKCISHLSWGADRKTLTTLYRSLIQSKLNYSLEVVSSKEKCIEAINRIQNEALRTILGAFRSSPVKSLQVEAGIMPIHLQAALTCTKHYLRMQQITKSPATKLTAQAVHGNENWNFKTQVHKIIGEELSERTINVMENTQLEMPPWRIADAHICGEREMKKTNNIQENIMEFREHQQIHKDSIQVFTDGSKNEHGAGSAVAIPSMNLTDSRSMPKYTSIFTAEATAIVMAVSLINRLPQKHYTIYTDSKSTLEALRQHDSRNPVIRRVKEMLHHSLQKEKYIKLCWTPAHVGVQGNEQADRIAKRATLMPSIQIELPYTDILPIAKLRAMEKWQNEWNEEINNKLHEIKPMIRRWESSFHKKRRYETILARLRIGHSNITHVHLVKGEPQPTCCNETLSVSHILTSCRKHNALRMRYYPECNAINREEMLRRMIGDSNKDGIEKLMKYLSESGLFKVI